MRADFLLFGRFLIGGKALIGMAGDKYILVMVGKLRIGFIVSPSEILRRNVSISIPPVRPFFQFGRVV